MFTLDKPLSPMNANVLAPNLEISYLFVEFISVLLLLSRNLIAVLMKPN